MFDPRFRVDGFTNEEVLALFTLNESNIISKIKKEYGFCPDSILIYQDWRDFKECWEMLLSEYEFLIVHKMFEKMKEVDNAVYYLKHISSLDPFEYIYMLMQSQKEIENLKIIPKTLSGNNFIGDFKNIIYSSMKEYTKIFLLGIIIRNIENYYSSGDIIKIIGIGNKVKQGRYYPRTIENVDPERMWGWLLESEEKRELTNDILHQLMKL